MTEKMTRDEIRMEADAMASNIPELEHYIKDSEVFALVAHPKTNKEAIRYINTNINIDEYEVAQL
tara:strand:+ start:209 stop:403 length:195 start_codon:yes stop_codon:yes gene_type:complete